MALCKRRGFVFQASEIYGGINGFWDYGPLGSQLKKNLRDAWWNDIVMVGPGDGPDGKPVKIVGLDSCIIQNPKVWEASGHVGGFNDPMVDCRACKARFRADHLMVERVRPAEADRFFYFSGLGKLEDVRAANEKKLKKLLATHGSSEDTVFAEYSQFDDTERTKIPCPECGEVGELTEPRDFNLMFKTYLGATATEHDIAYLRPETAQGIFVNFPNVVNSTRIKAPFGIAQTGKAFRNEVTPRNFTFRSREFEQMEVEFFITPDEHLREGETTVRQWYEFWRDSRMAWWESIGLGGDNLQLREHDSDELAHYAKEGAGTSDIEYRFPFTAPGFGELEGVAHRSDFDLRQHQEHSKQKMEYFDPDRGELAKNGQPKGLRYLPHVIEPSAGLDRGVLAVLCEAYTYDETRASKEFMRFHPRLAPIKAAVFPLVNKNGMPEVAEKLYGDLRKRFARFGGIEYDVKQSIGKRYARMDEAGCPFCFTVDGDTLTENTVTVRDRDTAEQERIGIEKVGEYLGAKLGL